MSNHVAVLMACLGLFAAMFGLFGLQVALAVAGTTLFLVSTVLLIDFPTGKG